MKNKKRKGKTHADIGKDNDFATLMSTLMVNFEATKDPQGLQLRGAGITLTCIHRPPFEGSWGEFLVVHKLEPPYSTQTYKATSDWPRYYNKIEDAMKDVETWLKEHDAFLGSFWSSVMQTSDAGLDGRWRS